MSKIKDVALAPSGELKIDWVKRNCPLLRTLESEFTAEKPFAGASASSSSRSCTQRALISRSASFSASEACVVSTAAAVE